MSVAMSAAPSSVTLTDHDLEALMLAEQSAKENGLAKVSARPLDWQQPEQWPAATEFDAVLATDVLYHGTEHGPLVAFLQHALLANDAGGSGDKEPFAVFIEPVHHERVTATDGQQFEAVARDAGLVVEVTALPGPRPMQLIRVTA